VAAGRRALQRELEQGRAAELPGLAQKIAARHQIDLRVLRGPDRRRAVSAAWRALARAVVVERGIRPVEVSRYLGVSPDPKIRWRKITRARLASPDPKYLPLA
jgi:hypothetical protein